MIYNANLMSLLVLSIFNVVLVAICFLQLEILKRRIKSMKEMEKELRIFLKTEVVEDIYNQVWERIKSSLRTVTEEIAQQENLRMRQFIDSAVEESKKDYLYMKMKMKREKR